MLCCFNINICPFQDVPNFLKMEAANNPEGYFGIYGFADGFGGKDIREESRFGLINKPPTDEDDGWY